MLQDSGLVVQPQELSNSLRNGVILHTLAELLTDTPCRITCGRAFHASPTSLEDVLDNSELLIEHLCEFGVPIRKGPSATGETPTVWLRLSVDR